MLGAELLRLPGWMERVGEEQEGGDEGGLGGSEDGGHAASVGMAAEEDASGSLRGWESAERFDGSVETGLIACGGTEGWAVGTGLAEGEIAAEDGEA
jgi:hypothetical protein